MRSTILDIEAVPCGEVAEFLERKPKPEIQPLKVPGNYKKPEAIEAWLLESAGKPQREYEQALAEWEQDWQKEINACVFDPDLLQIVALGALYSWHPEPAIFTTEDMSEANLLRCFWAETRNTRLIGYNLFGYDALALMRRSDYLGVPYQPINIDRYRSEHADLQQKLWFNGAHRFTKGKSLKFYSKRFALGVPDDDEDGSKVADWVAAGNWAKVEHHLRRDLERTRGLAIKLGYLSGLSPEQALSNMVIAQDALEMF